MDERYEVPAGFAAGARVDAATRSEMYERSLADPDGFWLSEAKRLDWLSTPTQAGDWSFDEADFHVRWFADGKLNASANCLDRHVAERGEQTAILWEPDDPAEEPRRFSYAEALAETCRFANVLKGLGVGRGDRVTIYMPMIPEAAFAMLACVRVGAIHSVVFGGFSADALASRIADCDSKLVVTADEGRRGGRRIPLKATVDQALDGGDGVSVLVVRATGAEVAMRDGRDHWYHARAADAGTDCPPEPMDAEDPLFILYTSGSTGRPKGVMHTQAGYLLWATCTFALTFDYRAPEVFWCTADIGWVTGHSYIVYGPLAAGATTLMFEGVPNWPDASRIWQVVDRHEVATVYTAPTALRSLMREGDAPVKATSRKSLRLLGTVGEPINPEAWRWYSQVVGEGRCPIVDTWWQTETGGHMITPLPGAVATKPGSATLPFFGVEPKLLDAEGREKQGAADGALVIARSWPGQMRGVWGDDKRFFETYFRTFPGVYDTGDGARRDADGYWWITGRIDDVLNVSGHRMGTAEIESALVLDEQVAEAAVVGMPHEVKGQGIYAFVTLNAGVEGDEAILKRLRDRVRREIGAIAAPDAIQFAPGLPKTRSGKIMRRILRKIAAGDTGDLGDTSTLADPAVVDDLVANRIR